MLVALDKVLRHAEQKLQRQSNATLENHLDLFKKFLKLEDQRLAMQHRYTREGLTVCRRRAGLLDVLIQHSYKIAQEEYEEKHPNDGSSCAIVAVGGYGRGELNFHSDIDIMFLFPDKVDGFGKFVLNKILYLLWDLGMTVGHSARTVTEAMQICETDLVSRTALFESRLIAGDAALFHHLDGKLNERFVRVGRTVQSYLAQKRLEREERHQRFGSSLYLQEPNVKESIGGIRDLHNVFWVLRLKYGSMDLGRAITHHLLTEKEAQTLTKSYDFLLAVRNELHLCAGKKMDILTRAYQPRIARAFGVKESSDRLAAELFMKKYYLHVRTIAFHSTNILAKLKEPENLATRSLRFLKRKELESGLMLMDDTIFMARKDEGVFRKDPLLILRIFSLAQSRGASIHEDLKAALRNNLNLVEKKFQTSPDAATIFRQILSRKGSVGPTLRTMHETGFLGKYIPEFGKITCLVQDSEYHRYTTDEHSIKAIENVDALYEDDSSVHATLKNVAAALKDVDLLYLALILHDLGKLDPDDHVSLGLILGQKVMKRFGLNAEETDRVLFLIREHLSMSHLAQRRDLEDTKTILDFSLLAKTPDNLSNLLLLTYADGNAVGPGIWTPWKEALVVELHDKTQDWLAGKTETQQHRPELLLETAKKVQQILGIHASQEPIVAHLKSMPLPYSIYAPAALIARHFQLVQALGDQLFLVDYTPTSTNATMVEVTVCSQDRAGLFATLAGCFTLSDINIISAQINTSSSGIVLDTFRVSNINGNLPIESRTMDRFKIFLKKTLAAEINIADQLKQHEKQSRSALAFPHKIPPVALLDNHMSASKSMVEIQAMDRPGLLYHISKVLAELELNISAAKISTERALVYDVFYVTGKDGKKILDEVFRNRIIQTLLKEIGE